MKKLTDKQLANLKKGREALCHKMAKEAGVKCPVKIKKPKSEKVYVDYFVLGDPTGNAKFRFTNGPFKLLKDAKESLKKEKGNPNFKVWKIERHEATDYSFLGKKVILKS